MCVFYSYLCYYGLIHFIYCYSFLNYLLISIETIHSLKLPGSGVPTFDDKIATPCHATRGCYATRGALLKFPCGENMQRRLLRYVVSPRPPHDAWPHIGGPLNRFGELPWGDPKIGHTHVNIYARA